MLRPVEDSDRGKLRTISYSQASLKKQCDFRYKLKYIDGNHSESKTLPLELGSILHKGLELKARELMCGSAVSYEYIHDCVVAGCQEKTDKGTEKLRGIEDLAADYFADWYTPDNASGMDYDEKMSVYFNKVLPTRMEDDLWKVIGAEVAFEFVYKNRCIIHGFIDRIDQSKANPAVYRITDYKSSKKVFPESDIKTPLQMVIYDMACYFLYGVVPEEHVYDFILLDQMQGPKDGVCTKGYLKRGLKQLDKILDSIDDCITTGLYKPSPSPLCYWCDFADAGHTPNASERLGGMCPYYSLWTPEERTFKVNQPWDELTYMMNYT